MELLKERAKTHGDFGEHARITQYIKAVYHTGNWDKLNLSQKETMEMIAHKQGRILAGDPDHIDHWEDIAGYAMLIVQQLREEK